MTSKIVQFHAEPIELLQFISDLYHENNIHVVSMSFRPFSLKAVSKEDLNEGIVGHCKYEKLIVIDQQPELHVNSQVDFYKKNKNGLTIEIGSLSKNGLSESCMSMKTNDAELPDFALLFFKHLKKWTKAGAIAYNPTTNARSTLRAHRYTVKAKELQQQGVEMLPIAGSNRILLGEI